MTLNKNRPCTRKTRKKSAVDDSFLSRRRPAYRSMVVRAFLFYGFVHAVVSYSSVATSTVTAFSQPAVSKAFHLDHQGPFVPLISRYRESRVRLYQSSSSDNNKPRSSLTNAEIARYSRHLVLSDVGMAGQIALKNAAVLVIGAGGLGSPCLLYLAAAGVGHIGIVDADVVDESNLQRQVIHGTSTVGISKCQSAAQRINDINPHVKVRTYEQEFTASSGLDIVGNGFDEETPYDIVIDGSDNFPTKYLIK